MIATSTDLDLALRSPTAKAGNVMVEPAARDFDASGRPILAEMIIQANNPGKVIIQRAENPSAVTPAVIESIASPFSSLSLVPSEEEILAQVKAVTGDVGVEVRAGSFPIEEESAAVALRPSESIASKPSEGKPGILPTVSSPSATGGIDFRALPIVTQAVSNLSLNTSRMPLSSLESINLDQELREIQKLVGAGITPSAERIKEYVQVSCLKGNADMQKLVSCIADILRLEEERCCVTEAMLKDILVVLESARSVQELKTIFVGNQS